MQKTKNGMFLKAIKELNIDKYNSFMIGDSLSDYYASKKTNIKFVKVGNEKFEIKKKITNKKDILAAVNYIINYKKKT